MRHTSALTAFGTLFLATSVCAQLAVPPAPWRGAGPTPCVGSDGGVQQCAPAARTMAIRAGRLFDSKTGRMLSKQVVVIEGERIAGIGPESEMRIPAGAQVIDLSQSTVLPGLIDAHTHMFNNPKPGMSRETSTLIAVHNLQADLRAGFTCQPPAQDGDGGQCHADISVAQRRASEIDGARIVEAFERRERARARRRRRLGGDERGEVRQGAGTLHA